jgi:hypothetical protein
MSHAIPMEQDGLDELLDLGLGRGQGRMVQRPGRGFWIWTWLEGAARCREILADDEVRWKLVVMEGRFWKTGEPKE